MTDNKTFKTVTAIGFTIDDVKHFLVQALSLTCYTTIVYLTVKRKLLENTEYSGNQQVIKMLRKAAQQCLPLKRWNVASVVTQSHCKWHHTTDNIYNVENTVTLKTGLEVTRGH